MCVQHLTYLRHLLNQPGEDLEEQSADGLLVQLALALLQNFSLRHEANLELDEGLEEGNGLHFQSGHLGKLGNQVRLWKIQ